MKKTLLCLALLLVVTSAACSKKNTTPPAATPTPTTTGGGTAAANGQAIYKQNCISCHGDTLQGGVGPNLTKVGAKYSKDQIVTIVSNGKGAMPAFKGKLSDADIGSLSDWLAAQK